MLFRKDIEPSCSYCVNSSSIDEETMICVRKGITSPWQRCERFQYDPLKRVPDPPEEPADIPVSPECFDDI
ncbi:MAG: hypothetical protein ILP09_04815 [Oscillospiraceae bacterium]|nr:hypothetical protein [Oscillospiraceae bacterium]